jgi:hypothetical protein
MDRFEINKNGTDKKETKVANIMEKIREKIDAIKGMKKILLKRSPCLVDKEEITKYIYLWPDIRSPSYHKIKIFVEKVK